MKTQILGSGPNVTSCVPGDVTTENHVSELRRIMFPGVIDLRFCDLADNNVGN